jgi:hypothetical protein
MTPRMLLGVRRLLRAYMAYWKTPYGRATRRRYLLTMTPTIALFDAVALWAREWTLVAICTPTIGFGLWSLHRLTERT